MSGPLAVSLGDPSGIGAEVLAKALAAEPRNVQVFGPALAWSRAWARYGAGPMPPCEDVGALGEADLAPGTPTDAGLRASAHAVIAAVEAVQCGHARALVTAPLVKKALALAGHDVPGHTELLMALTGAPQVAMMLGGDQLRVIVATTHCALREVPERLRRLDLVGLMALTARELQTKLGIARPRLALAALNPHGGEGGRFGDEERTLLEPAVARARALGVEVDGPLPSDTLFARHVRAPRHDAIVALYHDQALIPVKLLHFGDAVNTTLGLPFVRTSPDHGVAYDIAGRGVADPGSMAAALRQADALTGEVNSPPLAGV